MRKGPYTQVGPEEMKHRHTGKSLDDLELERERRGGFPYLFKIKKGD